MKKFNEDFLVVQNAINMTEDEAYKALLGENEKIKPYALLNIEKITNKAQTDLILSHLTGRDNPIREACAFLLKETCPLEFFSDEKSVEILLNSICDINPNVCRFVIEMISSNEDFNIKLLPPLLARINALLVEFSIYEKEFGAYLNNKMKDHKNHAKNKKLFNLYWLMEALLNIPFEKTDFQEEIVKILEKTVNFLDYTIREKTAKILVKIKNPPNELLQKLKNDENFYVKNCVYDKI